MRSALTIALLALLGLSQAYAATATANASARILEPVKVNLQVERERHADVRTTVEAVVIESFNDIHYDIAHSPNDVCLLPADSRAGDGGETRLAMASCETFTVNFN